MWVQMLVFLVPEVRQVSYPPHPAQVQVWQDRGFPKDGVFQTWCLTPVLFLLLHRCFLRIRNGFVGEVNNEQFSRQFALFDASHHIQGKLVPRFLQHPTLTGKLRRSRPTMRWEDLGPVCS